MNSQVMKTQFVLRNYLVHRIMALQPLLEESDRGLLACFQINK